MNILVEQFLSGGQITRWTPADSQKVKNEYQDMHFELYGEMSEHETGIIDSIIAKMEKYLKIKGLM